MISPELSKAFIKVEFPNSKGKVSCLGSPTLIGNPLMIADEYNSLSTIVYSFPNSLRLVITSLENLGSLAMDFNNGAFIERGSTYSMNFFCLGSRAFLRA